MVVTTRSRSKQGVTTRSQSKMTGESNRKRKNSGSPPEILRTKKKRGARSSPKIGQSSKEVKEHDLKMDEFSDYTPEAVESLIAEAEELTSGEDSDVIIAKLIKSIKWLIWYNEIRAKEIPPEKRFKDELEACFLLRPALKRNLAVDLSIVINRIHAIKNIAERLKSPGGTQMK